MVEVVRDVDRRRITPDPDEQDYCDFLSWASQQDDPEVKAEFGLRGPARFFADGRRLTEYYKGSGDLLYAAEVSHPEGMRWELPLGRWLELGPYGRFCNLFKAISVPRGGGAS